MAATASTVDALMTLRQRLDDTARALTDADLTRLLDSESQLQSALASLVSRCTVTRSDTLAIAELHRIRQSLQTCRRLGVALNDIVELSWAHVMTDPVTHTFRQSA